MLGFYLNRSDRPDRNRHMQSMLTKHGIKPVRFEALTTKESGGFRNARIKGNWMSHVEMITASALHESPVLIFEDDVDIVDARVLLSSIRLFSIRKDMDVLYLHSGSSWIPERIWDRDGMHAYMVRQDVVEKLVSRLAQCSEKIELEKPKDNSTCIDQVFAHVIQHEFKVWGVSETVVQIDSFGSDTGCGKHGFGLTD